MFTSKEDVESNGTGAMNAAEMQLLWGSNMKIVI